MQTTRPISEAELRAFVRDRLSGRASAPGARMFEELGIERGGARVDLALVEDGLEAFELKSDLDNFGRLHNQIHAYNRVFDRITLVTGSTLSDAALDVMPRWWGIWAVRRLKNGNLSLKKIRDAARNPRQETRSLATLLWREEAADVLLDETGELPSKRASRAQLCDSIAEQVQLHSLRRHVARRLVSRQAVREAIPTMPAALIPSGDWSHHDANCLDFHFPT
ncbi:sce7726 family protein [Pseudorhodoferax sp. LjRoot39]|uniref:sce7726 family protein n=1 Tax=Pseudorhodoferax sp. LjRoot39 TaxID=3342328 RepID=UPI003ECFC0E3